MTDYTERFRTLSIQQMQQVLAVCADYVTNLSTAPSEAKERIDVILAPPFNVDPADEALVDAAMAKREAGLNVTPMARAIGNVIRSGHLVAGKRYREPAGREVFACTESVCPKLGEICSIRQTSGWLSLNSDGFCGYVTAVELVEDESEPDSTCRDCGHARSLHLHGPCSAPGLHVECMCGRFVYAEFAPDPTIIRAAEGVTLEPGEYDTVAIDYEDEAPSLRIGERFSLAASLSANSIGGYGPSFDVPANGGVTMVTAVRRVEPNRCAVCGLAFKSMAVSSYSCATCKRRVCGRCSIAQPSEIICRDCDADGCWCDRKPWNPLTPFDHRDDCPRAGGECRGCGKPLLKRSRTMADGCPCNSPRGVNHGIVPEETCTCEVCDPAQTGGSRWVPAVRRVDPKPASEPVANRKHVWWCKRGEHEGECNAREPVAVASAVGEEECMCGHTRDWHFNLNERCGRLLADKQCECEIFRPVAASPQPEPVAPAAGGEREPIPMFLTCPKCNARHVDEGEFATKPHHTHSCQSCGLTWRPAVCATVGVEFLPGFKNEPTTPPQQPAERVEPGIIDVSSDVGPEAVAQMDRLIESINHEIASLMPEHLPAHWDQLTKERDAALATVAKLENELGAAKRENDELRRILLLPEHNGDVVAAAKDLVDQWKKRGESARAGLDPKACGELIETARSGISTSVIEKEQLAEQALDKLAAMLGVEVAGG